MKLEFLMCGNHSDHFLSQAAMFRKMLDSFGGDHAAARLVLCLGGEVHSVIPDRWRQAFARIEVQWTDSETYRRDGDLAQSDLIYQVLDPTANISVICDADTLLLRPLPSEFLAEMTTSPTLAACIAHGPPLMQDFRNPAPPLIENAEALWQILAEKLLDHPLPMHHRYSLLDGPCPFYINLGFFAGTPRLLAAFHREHRAVVPIVREVLENDFYEQISVPFSAARAGLPVRALPIRFNYPNCPIADALYPDEMAAIITLHYLREQYINRRRIFAEAAQFAQFMAMPLEGSNVVFREAIRMLTGGVYPFPP